MLNVDAGAEGLHKVGVVCVAITVVVEHVNVYWADNLCHWGFEIAPSGCADAQNAGNIGPVKESEFAIPQTNATTEDVFVGQVFKRQVFDVGNVLSRYGIHTCPDVTIATDVANFKGGVGLGMVFKGKLSVDTGDEFLYGHVVLFLMVLNEGAVILKGVTVFLIFGTVAMGRHDFWMVDG